MKKYTEEVLAKMDAIEVYKLVLRGDAVKKFPKGFWEQPEAKENAIRCIKYLFEDILNYDDELIKEHNTKQLYRDYKLSGMLKQLFCNSPFDAISSAYDNKFREWEFKNTPKKFWNNKENGIRATRWLVEEKLKLTDEQLKKELSTKMFTDNNLKGMLIHCFNNSIFTAITSTYGDKYHEWEFSIAPNNFWDNKENGIRATRWLIEEKLKLTDNEIKEKLSVQLFKENGLGGMLQHVFGNSPFKAVNQVYPNRFTRNDFMSFQKNNGI